MTTDNTPISAETAQNRLNDLNRAGPEQWGTGDGFLAELLRTVIHQSDQIKRLQKAVVEWRGPIEERFNIDLVESLIEDGIIEPADMEDT